MTEDRLEQECLGWLADVGWQHRYGPELASDGSRPERSDYRQVLLLGRLRRAVAALNPTVPPAARDDAVKPVVDLGTPVLLAANRQFHRLLVTGVPVQYQRDGETRGDFVKLVDWAEPARNDWLAVSQFSITGPRHTRRPDIILFVNGLPLVLIELKNPADPNADVWRAFHQIQTYKEQIADTFQYNEVLVISDGTDALLGSLSADSERFMAWRTIDGVTLDPLGPFNELQTLVRGVLAPAYLLDYLRFFVLFEDEFGHNSGLVKKIAGYHQFHAVRAAIAQAIAASRPDGLPGKDKPGGLVVDYIGIGGELKSALKEYTASKGRGRPTVDAHEAYSVLAEKLDALRGMLAGTNHATSGHGFDYSGFLTGGHQVLAGAANFVLGLSSAQGRDGKKRFSDLALAMSKAFTLCCTLDEAKAVREEGHTRHWLGPFQGQ